MSICSMSWLEVQGVFWLLSSNSLPKALTAIRLSQQQHAPHFLRAYLAAEIEGSKFATVMRHSLREKKALVTHHNKWPTRGQIEGARFDVVRLIWHAGGEQRSAVPVQEGAGIEPAFTLHPPRLGPVGEVSGADRECAQPVQARPPTQRPGCATSAGSSP